MQYIILSHDVKQADYYFRRAKAILNPVVNRIFPYKFEMVLRNETRIRFIPEEQYFGHGLDKAYRDAVVMQDKRFDEALLEYMKTVKDIKEIVKDDSK